MKKRNQYSDEFKNQVVQEVLSGQISAEAAKRKYGIRSSTSIMNWIRKFKAQRPKKLFMAKQPKKTKEQLELEIEQLKHQLEYERLKNEVLDTMIDIAEEEFKIPIRKKPGAKRSKK